MKQEIGSCKSQCRNAQAVTNHRCQPWPAMESEAKAGRPQ
ncbi:hypothetical protein [Thiolapillus sp.]